MVEQSFAYEIRENEICILRCFSSSAVVKIPQMLEGLPVTEISAYAFAEEMEDEPEWDNSLPCICGTKLEELYLPETIRKLGRYIFYNCLKLQKLSLYSNLAYIGAGAFTGCENLSQLELHWMEGNSCLREILQDLKQKVTVDCYKAYENTKKGTKINAKGPIFRLVFPEFYEEAVENTPARIISTQTHGMGIQYRNAFRNTQVIFSEYDRLFEMGKYNIDLINLIEIVVARCHYSYELEMGAKLEYIKWLSEHLKTCARFFVEQEDWEELRWLAEEFVTDAAQMEVLLEVAKSQKSPEGISMLMDVKRQRFPSTKKSFHL